MWKVWKRVREYGCIRKYVYYVLERVVGNCRRLGYVWGIDRRYSNWEIR